MLDDIPAKNDDQTLTRVNRPARAAIAGLHFND
jgi:hypothetical protein